MTSIWKKIDLFSLEKLVFLFVLAIGLFVSFYPVLLSGFQAIPGDMGDARFCHYILEYGYRWVSGQLGSFKFWDPPFFFPAKNSMAYSDVMLGAAPIYWILRAIGSNERVAYLLWMMGVSSLNLFVCYFWLKRVMKLSLVASAGGSFLFAFGSSRLNLLGHPQLLPVFFTPLAILATTEIFRVQSQLQRRLWELVVFLSVVGQLYAGFYMGWFLGLSLSVGLLIGFFSKSTRPHLMGVIREDWVYILLFGIFSLGLLYPMISHYLAAAQQVGLRTLKDIAEPKIQSWLYLGGGSFIYGWQDKIRGFQVIDSQEQRLGIGFFTLSIALSGLWSSRKEAPSRILGLLLVIFFVSSTSVLNQYSIWKFIYPYIPGAGAIRSLSRVGIFLLIVFAYGFSSFLEKNRTRVPYVCFLLAVCFVEQLRPIVTFNARDSEKQIREISEKIPSYCQSFYLAYDGQSVELPVSAMWSSLVYPSGRVIPTINGYSGNSPPYWSGFGRNSEALAWLDSWIDRNLLDKFRTCIVYW